MLLPHIGAVGPVGTMDMDQPSERRIVMAKLVARKWLTKEAKVEYRLTAYSSDSRLLKALPSLLRSFRDGRVRLASVQQITDLGIKENGDSVSVWSSDADKMVSLQKWMERHGYDTTGVW